MTYQPPFTLNSHILRYVQDIARILGMLTGEKIDAAPVSLRKTNSIKTIQASLAIEGNTLNTEQITDLLEGKRIVGPQKDILEVKNAIKLYDNLSRFDPLSLSDLVQAHGGLMHGLVSAAGHWRMGGVGVFKAGEASHVAPPADRVPHLVTDLFTFLSEDTETPWLIKACIFHYEFEFIHPFEDGNGRMGRLWQQLILMQEDPIFEFISVEELIKENQASYYDVLAACDSAGNSTAFIEFSLSLILQALERYAKQTKPQIGDAKSRLDYACEKMSADWFARKDYMQIYKDLSSASASRDLHYGVAHKILSKKGAKNQTRYKFSTS